MPQAPRQSKKAEKVAYDILGIPDSVRSYKKLQKDKKQKKINDKLSFDEQSRVR